MFQRRHLGLPPAFVPPPLLHSLWGGLQSFPLSWACLLSSPECVCPPPRRDFLLSSPGRVFPSPPAVGTPQSPLGSLGKQPAGLSGTYSELPAWRRGWGWGAHPQMRNAAVGAALDGSGSQEKRAGGSSPLPRCLILEGHYWHWGPRPPAGKGRAIGCVVGENGGGGAPVKQRIRTRDCGPEAAAYVDPRGAPEATSVELSPRRTVASAAEGRKSSDPLLQAALGVHGVPRFRGLEGSVSFEHGGPCGWGGCLPCQIRAWGE